MGISRRKFLTLVGAAGVAAVSPGGAIRQSARLISDPAGAWMWADGSLVDIYDCPELFSLLGYTYGKGENPEFFRLPNLMMQVEKDVLGNTSSQPFLHFKGMLLFRHIIKVRPELGDGLAVGSVLPYVGDELPG